MANLLNLVPTIELIPSNDVAVVEQINKDKDRINFLSEMNQYILDSRALSYDYTSSLFKHVSDDIQERVDNINDINRKLIRDGYKISEPLMYTEESYGTVYPLSTSIERLNSRRIVSLQELVKLANTLGFVIIPLDSVNDIIYECDPNIEAHALKNMVQQFNTDTNEHSYVLCPLTYYSLENHIKAEEYHADVYFPPKMDMIRTTMLMNIPIFRTIYSQLDNHEKRIGNLETNIEQLQGSIDSINQNITMIQKQLDVQAREMQQQRAKIIELEKLNEK